MLKGVVILAVKKKLRALVTLWLVLIFLSGCSVAGVIDGSSGSAGSVTPGLNAVADESNDTEPVDPVPEATQVGDEDLPGGAFISVPQEVSDDDPGDGEPEADIPEPGPEVVTLSVSAAGDVTLGGDRRWAGYHNFLRAFELSGNDYTYFLGNVRHIFEADDLTLVNLEGTLTDATEFNDKPYAFSGPPHFANILSSSGVEAVSLANNHIMDFRDRGYKDTVASLEAGGVVYFGNEFNTILEINGINVGLFGYLLWNDSQTNRNRITSSIEDLRDRGAELIIAYYHWGVERDNMPAAYQRALGRFSIDSGVDLVLGSHPHVIQGIELYNGRYIVYSMGNFCFGGNSNPPDQDTFIYRQTFTFIDGELQDSNDIEIIPARISSEGRRNNFQPTVAEGDDGERILQRIEDYSSRLPSG